ncbi:hypothetical protein GJ689_06955 [Rhodoplanes serenus]|uniref:Uncharacterized protein n=1 Tax=Rhodoplanes serenus TaxID=200615 RepID=A0A9X4XLU6_9BRAD|nr:hypothetical protein [Rhodoplanes serenus]MTW15944.1 hypothetical protein [Rhodoplanes serenus]
MPGRAAAIRIGFGLLVLAVLATAITTRPAKRLVDFDQAFYLTIAYDLRHHGVFSSGVFDTVDSTRAVPPPGMFFAPLYPWLVAAAATVDPRFGRTLDCTIEANENHRDLATCEIYARPVLLLHALLLALAVLAIGRAAEIAGGSPRLFYAAGALAIVGFVAEADLLSFVMTESLSIAVFSLFGLTVVTALARWRCTDFVACGVALGLACLTRPTFLLLAPVMLAIIAAARWLPPSAGEPAAPAERPFWRSVTAFAVALAVMLVPWLARNAVSIGKLGFTEEYGSAALIERIAFNAMTLREALWAVPACLPAVGPPLVERLAGPEAHARFVYDTPNSFFWLGRNRRDALVAAHGRLDPVTGPIVREELIGALPRHLATSLPLAWCGLWVGRAFGLLLVPLAAWGLVRAVRRRRWLLVAYAVPALVLVGVHGVLANHYPRYNLGLIGPASALAAWAMADALARRRSGAA